MVFGLTETLTVCGQRERAEDRAVADVLQIEPLGHRLLQRRRKFLVAQDEVGHLVAQLVGSGNVGQPLVGLAAVVLQFEHVLEDRKAALGARDAERVHEAEPVAPAGERHLQPRDVFGDDLGDDAMPVERRAVVAHEDFEPVQRRGDGAK